MRDRGWKETDRFSSLLNVFSELDWDFFWADVHWFTYYLAQGPRNIRPCISTREPEN